MFWNTGPNTAFKHSALGTRAQGAEDAMTIRDRIKTDLTAAMKAGDPVRVSTLRLIQTAIKDRDIAARAEDRCDGCEESEALALLQKLAKQRDDSAETYEKAGRLDLAEQERAEAEIVREYLPKPLDSQEIRSAAEAVIEDVNASSLRDMGKCMGELKRRYPGRLDVAEAGETVKTLLGE